MLAITIATLLLFVRIDVRRKGEECRVEKPAEPNTFALALLTDAIHAIVPVAAAHQRQTVLADCETAVESARTVFVDRSSFLRNLRLCVVFVLVRRELSLFKEGHYLVEHRSISGDADVERSNKRQPYQVVRNSRAHAAATWRMPPVLHVAFLKLVRRREQDLFARDLRTAVDERHHVLQLIAKTERAARLVERRTRPNATRKRLIQEPAIEHRIQRGVRRSHFNRAEQFIPMDQHFLKRGIHGSRLTVSVDNGLRRFLRFGFAEQKDDFAGFVWREFDHHLERRARIQSGTVAPSQAQSFQRRGSFDRTVATKKLFAIACRTQHALARRNKRDTIRKFVVERIPRKDGRCFLIDLSDDVRR